MILTRSQEILNSLNEKIKAAEEELRYLKLAKGDFERVMAMSKKSPVEEAFKDNYGVYPNELKTTDDFDCWKSFKRGYIAASKEASQEPSMINCIIEGTAPNGYDTWSQWFDEMGSKGILHNIRISSKD